MASISQTLNFNATTNINIGAVATDVLIIVQFICTRGDNWDSGEIRIHSPFTDTVVADPVFKIYFNDCGISVAADYSGANIRLKITVDNSVATNVVFNYNLSIIQGAKI